METITPAPDANVRALQQLLGERSAHGLAKYGTTTERTDLSLRDWLQHQLEELLDGAVYARAAIALIDQLGGDTGGLRTETVDCNEIASRVQATSGKAIFPSTVKLVLEAAGIKL